MTARLVRVDLAGKSPHWIRSIHRKVGGQAVEVIKVYRNEGGQAVLVYERVTDVIVTPAWGAAPVLGATYDLSGAATDVKGLGVNQGTAQLQVKEHGASTWTPVGNPVNITNGQWTVQAANWAHAGDVQLRVWVDVQPPLLDSASAEKDYTVGLVTPARPTGSALGHTTITLTWPAVPGATGYEVGNNTAVISGGTVTSPTLKVSTSQNTQYNFRVRAYVDLPGSPRRYSGWSPILYFNGGRPQAKDTGTKVVRVHCSRSGSHRNDSVGWGTNPVYVRQGYYSSPYGGAGYIGVFDYGSTTAVRNAIISAVGQTQYDKGSANSGYTKAYRRGDVGNRVTANIRFRVSKQGAGGSRPALAGTEVVKAMAYNSWNQVTLNSSLLHGLTKGGYRSLCIYVNNSADYAALNNHAAGSEDGDLWVTWKWDYVSQSLIAPRTWT